MWVVTLAYRSVQPSSDVEVCREQLHDAGVSHDGDRVLVTFQVQAAGPVVAAGDAAQTIESVLSDTELVAVHAQAVARTTGESRMPSSTSTGRSDYPAG